VPDIPSPFKWTRRSGGMLRGKMSAVSHGEPNYLTYFDIVLGIEVTLRTQKVTKLNSRVGNGKFSSEI